ncbi:bifunctional metallophosphatase/5'-nucleotidase [Anaeromyxobacter paludicola]|uniref:2',3'-cyclic-nucleotide 2'-phosphodiesterase n=1 Tax=Anaeromyxobacter paludicola TaxID=2918171 RepID=A0ABN6N168_9BACT|nr:5'-nucleotidase C-terminal domain-containing protein [Anaeromyxobacter paludicola]BDG06908.1 2',3'-cyclic-nucleotide 2'-phosphodiesterase [Anaeromyxobacter paludicola]
MLALALAVALTAAPRCVEVVELSDLHGRLDALPRVARAVEALRGRGPVLLFDGGDSMQGTLDSELSEGRAVVEAFGALGVDAAAVGNHDFDRGPEVLRARIAEAPYPYLAANVKEKETGRPPPWKNLRARAIFRPPGGPVVGVVGLATEETPYTTLPRNVAALRFEDAARTAAEEARALRAEGAEVVVALAHIGGRCGGQDRPRDGVAGCDAQSPVFRLARALPRGTVDAVLGGHTHEALSRRVNGVALAEPSSRAATLARVTLCAGRRARLHAPIDLEAEARADAAAGRASAAVAPFIAAAKAERERKLGVTLPRPLTRDRTALSTFGAAAAASLRAAGGADFGLVNGGALRVDLPAGELRYGQLYEALPFGDRVVVLTLSGREVTALVGAFGKAGKGLPQVSGLVVAAPGAAPRTCAGAALEPERLYTLATNDFIAAGGDGTGAVVKALPPERVKVTDVEGRAAFLRWLSSASPERLAGAATPCP